MKEINSHKLRILGTVELPQAIGEGKNYHVSVEGEVRGSSIDTNDDGTFDKTYKLKIATLELLNEKGQVMKAKDRRKMSQRLRGAIYFYGTENDPDVPEEKFYEQTMGKIITNLDKIIPFLK